MKNYDLKIFTDNVGANAVNQIYTLLTQPALDGSRVRIMPDVHVGVGCVVGFTATMTNKIIPNVIGVDIGCGMLIVELGKIEIDFASLDKFIKTKIPSGRAVREIGGAEDLIKKLRCYNELRDLKRLFGSLGTLGGGNHFIEIDRDEDDNQYLIIHSGSRNLGTQINGIYQKKAIESCKTFGQSEKTELIERLKAENRHDEIADELSRLSGEFADKTKVPNNLCYLEGADMEDYLHDTRICQEFARLNREKMATEILKFLGVPRLVGFETIHNFIDEFGVMRKGAVPAHKGQKILIPMNMRDGCIIATGKGNEDWNKSAPHGAGRLMSRSDAKQRITMDEFTSSMQGIYTTTVTTATLDESPMAYKPMDEIVTLIEPTAQIEKIIKPVYNFKAGD